MIGTAVGIGGGVKKENSCIGEREEKLEEKSYLKALDECGVDYPEKERNKKLDMLSNFMIQGSKEMSKQILFKCRIDEKEFDMRYHTSRTKEINDEIR